MEQAKINELLDHKAGSVDELYRRINAEQDKTAQAELECSKLRQQLAAVTAERDELVALNFELSRVMRRVKDASMTNNAISIDWDLLDKVLNLSPSASLNAFKAKFWMDAQDVIIKWTHSGDWDIDTLRGLAADFEQRASQLESGIDKH